MGIQGIKKLSEKAKYEFSLSDSPFKYFLKDI